jgi:hypothetical protein
LQTKSVIAVSMARMPRRFSSGLAMASVRSLGSGEAQSAKQMSESASMTKTEWPNVERSVRLSPIALANLKL